MSIRINEMGQAVASSNGNSQQQSTAQTVQKDQNLTVPESSVPASGSGASTSVGGSISQAQQSQTANGNTGNGVNYQQFQPTYSGKYDEALADLYNQITQRAPFTYNTNDDALYQQYMDRYISGGQKAMEDTIAQAADLTGGYDSSYAQRVGQQTYDEYMLGLNDRALELENTAYQRWRDAGDDLLTQYNMLGALDDRDYGRWADEYDRAMAEAALRATSGDFEPYKQMWGDEAGNRLQQVWSAQVLMPLYSAGQMDAETYKSIAGVYPVGYVPPGQGGSNGGSGSSWYVDAYNALNSKNASAEYAKTWYEANTPGATPIW